MKHRTFDDTVVNPQTLEPLLKQGFTARQIAEKLGVPLQDIHNAKRVFGIKSNRAKGRKQFYNVSDAFRESHKEQFERFLELHNQGLTYTEISNICGCSLSQVGKLFTIYGYSFSSDYKTKAAHAAVKGIKRSLEDLEKRALGKELNPPSMSRWEAVFASWLTSQGIDYVYSKAIGKYNVDFAIGSSIAVELYGGAFHSMGRAADRLQARMEYLINNGWSVYIIWCLSKETAIFPACLNDFIAFLDHTSRNESPVGQYRVIWSDGDFISSGSLESDYLTAIKPAAFRHEALRQYKTARN